MRSREIHDALLVAAKNPRKIQPFFIWGPPGVGKSQIVKQVAQELDASGEFEHGFGFKDIRLPLMDPTDLRGVPAVIDVDCAQANDGKKCEGASCKRCGGTGVVAVAKWLQSQLFPTFGDGFVLLDELSSAPPLVQVSGYGFVLDRMLGEYYLPDGYTILAAGNRMNDRAVVFPMSSALASRFSHMDFEANIQDWTRDWALPNHVDSNLIAFLNWRSELLAPEYNTKSSEKAFPNPRTWEFVNNLLNYFPPGSIRNELMIGTVGKGAAAEFSAFLRIQSKLPDIDQILKGKDIVPDGLDLKYALVGALVGKATPKQYTRLIEYSYKLDVELGVLLVTLMASKDIAAVTATGKAINEWSREHADIILPAKKD